MTAKASKIVRPDAKGRITLGNMARGVSSYLLTTDKHHRIILEPRVEIPANEKWLYNNKTALNQVKRGLKQSAQGELKNKGNFAKFTDEEDTD